MSINYLNYIKLKTNTKTFRILFNRNNSLVKYFSSKKFPNNSSSKLSSQFYSKDKILTQKELTERIRKNKTSTESKKFKLSESLILPLDKQLNASKTKELATTDNLNHSNLPSEKLDERKKSLKQKNKKKFSDKEKLIENFFSNSFTNEKDANKTFTLETTATETSKPIKSLSNLNETRYLTLEEKKTLMPNEQNSEFENLSKEELLRNEKAFLSKSSFKIRNTDLDLNGRNLLSKFKTLSRQSLDPIHLTILHDSLATKVSNILYEKIYKQPTNENANNVFIEYQPGFGLISRKLMENISNNLPQKLDMHKFIQIEPFGKFENFLKEQKLSFDDKFDIRIFKTWPFEYRFLYKTNKLKYDFIKSITETKYMPNLNAEPLIPKVSVKDNEESNEKKDIQLSIFGIMPWNSKGFISGIYTDYASNRGIFSLALKRKRNYFFYDIQDGASLNPDSIIMNDAKVRKVLMPELYIYVPEVILAKISADSDRKYNSYRCRLSVFSRLFSRIEVLDETKCDYFFPFPEMSKKTRNKKNMDKLDYKKMFLVHFKFNEDISSYGDENDDPNLTYSGHVRNKRLFYLFINHLYSRPTDFVHIQLKSLCRNVEHVCKENQINSFSPVNKINVHMLLRLYNYLLDNKEQSTLNNLKYRNPDKEIFDISEIDQEKIERAQDKKIRWKQAEIKQKSELNALKNLNKDFSGQFVLSSSFFNLIPETKPKNYASQKISNNENPKIVQHIDSNHFDNKNFSLFKENHLEERHLNDQDNLEHLEEINVKNTCQNK